MSKSSAQVLFVASVCFLGACIVFASWRGVARMLEPRPRIVCHEVEKDLGQVSFDEKPISCFTVANAGDAPLQIRKIVLGCGACLEVVSYPKEPLLPGERGTVELRLLADRLRGRVADGAVITKSVAVLSNDRGRPALALKIRARIQNVPMGDNGSNRARGVQNVAGAPSVGVSAGGADRP